MEGIFRRRRDLQGLYYSFNRFAQYLISVLSMNRLTVCGAVAIFVAVHSQTVSAQLFGPRNLGSTISPRASARQMPGLNASGRRFSREARRANSFVGADRRDTRNFVGRSAAGANPGVRSAVTGVTANQSANVNQPLQFPATGTMYLPRLVLAKETKPAAELVIELESALTIDLTDRLTQLVGSPIEVSVAERIATIRGAVASVEDRRRAEILASFEPGVSVVQNDLKVAGDSEAVAPSDSPPSGFPADSVPQRAVPAR